MRLLTALLITALTLAISSAQDSAGPAKVTLSDAGSPAPTKISATFATPTEGYFHVPVADSKRGNYVYWLRGAKAERVTDSAGEAFSGEYMPLVENGAHVFALPTVNSGTHQAYMLEKGKAVQIKTADGEPLAGANFEAYGPKPEYLQVKDTAKFYRLDGSVAVPLKLPAIKPELKYPTLVVTPTDTYLYDRNTIMRGEPGRLWRIGEKDTLTRVKWPDDEDAELGIAWFYNTTKSTYLVINEYEVQEDPDAEYQERFLWKLASDRLEIMVDGEGDDWFAVSLFTNAVIGNRLYLPGLVRDSEDIHVWTIAEGGKPSVVKSGGKPLSGADIDILAAGDRAIIKRKATEDGEAEFWLCDGATAKPINGADGKPLMGKGFVKFKNGIGLLALEVEKDVYRLHEVDKKLVARPVMIGSKPLEGAGSMFVPGMSLYAAEDGVYCRVVKDKGHSSMYLFTTK